MLPKHSPCFESSTEKSHENDKHAILRNVRHCCVDDLGKHLQSPRILSTDWRRRPPLTRCLTSKAAQTVDYYASNQDKTEAFVGHVFEEQGRILNDATSDMTQAEILAIFAGWARESAGITSDSFSR